MKLLYNIFGRIWAVWGLIIFVATLLVIVLPIALTLLIKDPWGTEIFRRISKAWMTFFLTCVGCRIILKGKENLIAGENYVLTCNHTSFMDVPLTTPFIPGPNKTIAKKSMAKIPLFGLVYSRGAILVDRKSDDSRRQSFEAMKQTLAKGLHMVIYPEGTRNRTGKPLKEFYDGAFKLALATNKNIVPTLLFHTNKVLPTHKTFFLWPHRLEMHFLPHVITQNADVKELKEEVFAIMWDYYSTHNTKGFID